MSPWPPQRRRLPSWSQASTAEGATGSRLTPHQHPAREPESPGGPAPLPPLTLPPVRHQVPLPLAQHGHAAQGLAEPAHRLPVVVPAVVPHLQRDR